MKYRKFGNTALQVSEIGFGAWAIGGAASVGGMPIGWGEADDATSTKAIYSALDAGINFFDTADFYGLGHSEDLLGKTVGAARETIIATKVGHRASDEKIILDYSKEYILKACEESLKRLQRDCIDYYQLHSARLSHLEAGECTEAMEVLKQQGKIRYWGLSLNTFHPQPEADYLMEQSLADGFQLVFNVINQRAIGVMEKAAAKGYGLIARMPLQFGLLTGKFSPVARFEKDDHRSFRLSQEILEQSLKLLNEKVWPAGEKQGLSKTSLALSYILGHPQISTVIPGMRTAEQVQANTEGLLPLSQEDKAMLQGLATEWEPIVQLMEQQG